MAHLIDKDALVTEIERRTDELYDLLPDASKVENGKVTISEACNTGKYTALESFKGYIDTLEVKEVDLEKAIGYYISNNFFGSQTMGFFANRTKEEPNDQDIALCAKYFFELGLRSTITEEDCKFIWNIGDEIPNMPEEEFFKELLKRYKVQKGEEL